MRINLLAAVGAAAAALVAGSATAATVYDPYDAFNLADGVIDTSVFRFGYSPGNFNDAPLTGFSNQTTSCGGAGLECAYEGSGLGVYKSTGPTSQLTYIFAPGTLNLHPGPSGPQAVVQFVAPSAGQYSFVGGFARHDVVGANTVSAAAFVNGASVFIEILGAANDPLSFDFTRLLAANDRVSFVVGADGGYSYDSTGLSLQVTGYGGAVPEPAAWALMIGGFGACGAMLRRRRTATA